jgi:trimethylamine:corrinoid methyltransferase-like protein
MPELISRKGYNAWQAEGGLTLGQRARAKLLEIMETHQPRALPPNVQQEMDALLNIENSKHQITNI